MVIEGTGLVVSISPKMAITPEYLKTGFELIEVIIKSESPSDRYVFTKFTFYSKLFPYVGRHSVGDRVHVRGEVGNKRTFVNDGKGHEDVINIVKGIYIGIPKDHD